MEGIGKLFGVFVAGGVVGAVLLAQVVGFQSPSAVDEAVSDAVDDALVDALVPALVPECVAVVKADDELMAKFKAAQSYQKTSTIRALVTHKNSAVKNAVVKECVEALKE